MDIIRDTRYSYPIKYPYGANYRFALVAKADYTVGTTSDQTDIVEVMVPSKSLPMVSSLQATKREGTINLSWDYRYEIPDLAGFRIYSKKKVLIREDEIPLGSFKAKVSNDGLIHYMT